MSYCVFDTETSGLFDFSKPADAPGQPRLASIAFVFLSDDFEIEREFYRLVRPSGWTMPYGATRVNGLTNEMLHKDGIPVRAVLNAFNHLVDMNYTFVAHNIQFDMKVMRGELRRAGLRDYRDELRTVCTMRSLTNVCRLPAKRGFKWPTLTEAFDFCFGETFENAHTALADARACAKIFQHMCRTGIYEEAA